MKDITSLGWLIVGGVLTGSGIRLMIVREIYGKVRLTGQVPALEGWPVFFAGMTETVAGLLLMLLIIRKMKG